MKTSHAIITAAIATAAAILIWRSSRKNTHKKLSDWVSAAQGMAEKPAIAAGTLYNALSGIIGHGNVPSKKDEHKEETPTGSKRTVVFRSPLGYLQATPSGIVYSNSQFIGSWEKFKISPSREIPGTFDIRSNAGFYLISDLSGSVSVGSGSPSSWTSWILEHQGGDKYLIKSFHGKYLSAHPEGHVDATDRGGLDRSLFHMIEV